LPFQSSFVTSAVEQRLISRVEQRLLIRLFNSYFWGFDGDLGIL
jgi:hypothetical protein